jgi:hypothetical protein
MNGAWAGWDSRRSHTWTATGPPSVATRAISRRAFGTSGKNISPDWHSTTSNEPSRATTTDHV